MDTQQEAHAVPGLDFEKVVTLTVTGAHEQVVEALELMATTCYSLATMSMERISDRDDHWRGSNMFQPGLAPNANEYSYYANRVPDARTSTAAEEQ